MNTQMTFLGILLLFLFKFSGIFGELSDIDEKKIITVLKRCEEESGAKEEEFEDPKKVFLQTPSEPVLCMVKCLLEGLKIIDDDGLWQGTTLRKYAALFSSQMEKELVTCSKITTEIRTCGTLEEVRKCIKHVMEKELKFNK